MCPYVVLSELWSSYHTHPCLCVRSSGLDGEQLSRSFSLYSDASYYIHIYASYVCHVVLSSIHAACICMLIHTQEAVPQRGIEGETETQRP